MTIIDLLHNDGITTKKAAQTGGSEYAGPCPWCGGNDRFRVWPGSGRYWCRGCGKAGDAIQYLRERRGLSFPEACQYLGRDPGPRKEARPAPAAWAPESARIPAEAWQEKARVFLDLAIDCLWTPAGDTMRAWLHAEKGLSDATIKAACLGLALADTFEQRGAWGLSEELNDKGNPKKQWIPEGLVIPFMTGDQIQRLRIRRDNPGDGQRYIVVSGSSSAPMTWGTTTGAAVIVESELDALLINQEAGELVSVVAMGSATAKPGRATHELLTVTPLILKTAVELLANRIDI